jgi:glycosyltransferase involved in cell wall biosynthesis
MSAPTFSVILTNYNYGRYVREAVDSALAQTVPALEVIVVDDGSTDDSALVLRQAYGDHSRVKLVFQANGGVLKAFRAGVRAAAGEVVCFLDADDLWEPTHLEALARAYQARPAPDFVYTNLRYFGQREGLYTNASCDIDLGLTALPSVFLREWYGAPTSALSLRRDLARRVLDLPEDFDRDWRNCVDNLLIHGASIYGAHKVFLSEATVRYRIHGHNDSLARRTDPLEGMRHLYRVQRLIAHCARKAGFDRESLRLAKEEFKTKPHPRAQDVKTYWRLVWRSPLGLFKKIEYSASIVSRFLGWRR